MIEVMHEALHDKEQLLLGKRYYSLSRVDSF
jgi:hypothetical protein